MMPGMVRTRGRVLELYKFIVPIGCCFAVMLYGSNRAYLYCSVAFLQFMKEANVVLVFLFSAIAGLQMVNRQRLVVITWVILGSSLCVSGEVHFVFLGFLLQGTSQFAECARAVMAELVLSSNDFKLDPLSYTLFMSPVCLAVLIVGNIVTWKASVMTDAAIWWPCLLPNACLASLLNATIALVIKETSAVGFIITGIVKDTVLVVFSSAIFHDTITTKQWISFCVTLSGVFFWSFMKIWPEHTLVAAFERVLCVGTGPCPGASLARKEKLPSEATPLSTEKRV